MACSQQFSFWRDVTRFTACSGLAQASAAVRNTENAPEGSQYALRAILASSPTRVTHPSRAGALSLAAVLLSRHMAQWPGVIAVGAGSKSGMVKKARV